MDAVQIGEPDQNPLPLDEFHWAALSEPALGRPNLLKRVSNRLLKDRDQVTRTDRRLAGRARRTHLRHADTTFIFYHCGRLTDLPWPLERCLEYVAALRPDERPGMCLYRCQDMLARGIIREHWQISPRDQHNIRGTNGSHYLASLPLADGRHALVDPTWPGASASEKLQGFPYGIVVLGASLDQAADLAEAIYGGRPA